MKPRLWLSGALFSLLGCTAEQPGLHQPLTVERIFSSPSLSGPRWQQVQISPDGKWVTYLQAKPDAERRLCLWGQLIDDGEALLLVDADQLETSTGAVELTDFEKGRRERQRISSSGVVQYAWSKNGEMILIPYQGQVFIWSKRDKALKKVTQNSEICEDPQLSPRGDQLVCVSQFNLYLIDLKRGHRQKLTAEGTEQNPIGLAEFIAQEEMGRQKGFWWSPDGDWIAYTRVDQSQVQEVQRYELFANGLKVIKQKYPSTGTANAQVELWLLNLKTSKKQLIFKTQVPDNEYLSHVQWLKMAKGPGLLFQSQSRNQKKTEVSLYTVQTLRSEVLLTETDPAWVNIYHDWHISEDGQKIYWLSEQTGHTHVHELDLKTKEQRPLTQGKWDVTGILRVDPKHLYYTSNSITPLETHLSRVTLAKSPQLEILLSEPGTHAPVLPKEGDLFIDQFSSLQKPPEVRLHHLSGKRQKTLLKNTIDGTHPLVSYRAEMGTWQNHSVITNDGELFYRLLLPPLFNPKTRYPVIQYVYGGPGNQVVRNVWGQEQKLFQHVLAQNRFIVLEVDNRGTPGRGRDFERAIHRGFADVEVEDQSAVLKHALRRFPFLDANRVGVYGHSYGGYLSLMLLSQRPDLYKVGVAGAPVVDWRLYDTHYTERYLGLPNEEKALYEKTSVLSHIDNLRGRLLVIHGMADDNVLFTHSTNLFSALQNKGQVFDMMTYPGAKHGLRESEATQIHHHKTILDHFKRHL